MRDVKGRLQYRGAMLTPKQVPRQRKVMPGAWRPAAPV